MPRVIQENLFASLQRQMDWTAGANLLKGVYNTLLKFSYVAHLPHLKVRFTLLHFSNLAQNYTGVTWLEQILLVFPVLSHQS